MDHTSELEPMAAHHHVNSDEEGDMLLEEPDLKDLKQISLASLDHAGDYRSLDEELSGWFKGTDVGKLPIGPVTAEDCEALGFSNSSGKTGHLSSSSHTGDVSLKGRDHNKNRASMQKVSSWIAAMTFPGCLLLSNYRPYSSLCNEQRSFFSIWLPLHGMLNFTAFLSSLLIS